MMSRFACAVLCTGLLASPATAQDPSFPQMAKHVQTRLMARETPHREQAPFVFGHFLKAPPPQVADTTATPRAELPPEIRPQGVMVMPGGILVIIGGATYRQGDVVPPGARIVSLTRTEVTFEYLGAIFRRPTR